MTNFGYETKGGTPGDLESYMLGTFFTITEDGTADSITVYLQIATQPHFVKCAIYKHSDMSLVGSTEVIDVAAGFDDWKTFNFSDPKPSLTQNTEYVLTVWGEATAGSAYVYYDTGDTDQSHYELKTLDGWENPWEGYTHWTVKISIYCTYTTAEGLPIPVAMKHYRGFRT